jgi:hypothetical protein
MVWTGERPGEAECREYGLGFLLKDGSFFPDLTRLVMECRWDADAGRWVLDEQVQSQQISTR